MIKLLFSLLAALVMMACQKQPTGDDCIDPELIQTNALCTTNYDPVCGCNGQTYINGCEARFQHGLSNYTRGACGCNYEYTGVVKDYTGLDGCGLVIELSSGEVLEPVKLPEDYDLIAGMQVELNYRVVEQGSYCMTGPTVEVLCIRDISCKPISDVHLTNPSFPVNEFIDPITIKGAHIEGNCLIIDVSYGGGCEEHDFRLERMPLFCGTPPLPPTILSLTHDGNGDLCQALLFKSLSFDLSSLQDSASSQVKFYLRENTGLYNELFTYHY